MLDHGTERQRRDGMCWKSPQELYNDGGAFKITARNASGVMVTNMLHAEAKEGIGAFIEKRPPVWPKS